MSSNSRLARRRDLVEIFGYSPTDLTPEARTLWRLGACPFINNSCIKHNHDQSIIYGTCSVTSPHGDIIICPNRLYANDYESIKNVTKDAFGDQIRICKFNEYIAQRSNIDECAVLIGQNSGKEIKLGQSLSMDWIVAKINRNRLIEYIGVEVQSIDITGNYRDAWHSYERYNGSQTQTLSESAHGLNWANVHKRLIPQLIRKGVIYSHSRLCLKGLYFVLPEIVYNKFEDVVGNDMPLEETSCNNTITVFTYSLDNNIRDGQHRNLINNRIIRFKMDEFSNRFISGPNLPSSIELDSTIKRILGVS